MFKQKKGTHKQSKFFTLMLVPYSSSKIKSIKIPHWALYTVFISVAALALVAFTFSSTNAVLQNKVSTFKANIDEVTQQNGELSEEAARLNEKLESDRVKALEDIQAQKETYENSLDFYEDKVKDFNLKIEELEKAKEEIYDKLSKMDLPDSLKKSLTVAKAPDSNYNVILTSTNSEQMEGLDTQIVLLEERLLSEMEEFEILTDNLKKIKPYIESFPSLWPVRGTITSEVGGRANPFTGGGYEGHSGMDISVPTGTSVKATGAGEVTFAGWKSDYGYLVIIDHGYGLSTRYGHNSEVLVEVGEKVSKGDIIAKSGNTGRSTGPHVHYEVRLYDAVENPRDYIGKI